MANGAILSVEYDSHLLYTRNRVLQQIGGYRTVGAGTFREAQAVLGNEVYALVLMGHTVPKSDRERLEKAVRLLSPSTRILVLYNVRDDGDVHSDGSICANDGPRVLLGAVSTMVGPGAIQPKSVRPRSASQAV